MGGDWSAGGEGRNGVWGGIGVTRNRRMMVESGGVGRVGVWLWVEMETACRVGV